MNIRYTIELNEAGKLGELQADLASYNADEKKKIKDRIGVIKKNHVLTKAFNAISKFASVEQLDMIADMEELKSYSIEKIGTGKVYEITFNFNPDKIKLLNQMFSVLGPLKSKRESQLRKQTRDNLAFYGKILSEEELCDAKDEVEAK